ncbi:MAG: family 10 glycosylhydrolase [Cyanobacteria bacterium J06623_7]
MLEIRGVWITNRPHSQVLESRANIVEALDFLHAYGFNTIFPVVWNRGYTLYPSQVMKQYHLSTIDPYYQQQQRDPLAEIITEARKRQIAIIPWLEYGFAASHLVDGGHILQTYPHWQAEDRTGNRVRHGSLTWMNGFHPEVQQFMTAIVSEIVRNYDVDGIQGCDRLPALPVTAGYDFYTRAKYQSDFDRQPPPNHRNREWIQWRADILTQFLARMYRQVKKLNSQALVSLSPAVYPFCLDNLLQDTPAWIEQDLCDIIHPQIYRSSFSAYHKEVKKIVKTCDHQALTKFAPGIAFTANGKDVTHKDLVKCIKINRNRHLSGQVFFHYEGLRRNNDATAIALARGADYDHVAGLPEFLG